MSLSIPLSAGDMPTLYVIRGADKQPLQSADSTIESHGGRESTNRVMGMSADRHFVSGLYSAPAGKDRIDSYPVDEFMYFVKGDMSLTSSDGTTIRLVAGDAVHVPKGWKGAWETAGYTKYYVAYE